MLSPRGDAIPGKSAVDLEVGNSAQTKSPSDGSEVRWYFSQAAFSKTEVAADVPSTEVVGRGDYLRFSLEDSEALELAFKQREEELLSSWWREYAECTSVPKPSSRQRVSVSSKLSGQNNGSQSDRPRRNSWHGLGGSEDDFMGVPVKGGLAEVDMERRRMFPVYWDGDSKRVLRGLWFAKQGRRPHWLPIREDVAEQLEFAYQSKVWRRHTVQDSGVPFSRLDLIGASQVMHVLFTGDDDTWEAWLVKNGNKLVEKALTNGLVPLGLKLRRGFAPTESSYPTKEDIQQEQEEAQDDYSSQVPVQHVVFMVHGIGQRLENANLVRDVTSFRRNTVAMAERHLTAHQRLTQRCLFIPCQWRRSLKLRGEAAVKDITLEGVPGLRAAVSATVHDVLYYMSPAYCQDIVNSVTGALNRLYRKFKLRNPQFTGKVSLFGHSLGSVLTYDILCHQSNCRKPPSMNVAEPLSLSRCRSRHPVPDHVSAEGICTPAKEDAANESKDINDIVTLQAQIASLKRQVEALTAQVAVRGVRDASPELDHHSENVFGMPFSLDISHKDDERSSGIQQIADEGRAASQASHQPGSESSSEYDTREVGDTSLSDSQLDDEGSLESHITSQRHSLDEFNYFSHPPVAASTSEDSTSEQLPTFVASLPKSMTVGALSHTSPFKLSPGDTSSFLGGDNRRDQGWRELGGLGGSPETYPVSIAGGTPVLGPHCGQEELPTPGSCRPWGLPKCARPRILAPRLSSVIHYSKLDFEVDTLYAVGSPLGLFMALRNIRPGMGEGPPQWCGEGLREEMPACRQLVNIFHPYDPVAYRIEPLISADYRKVRPVVMAYHKRGRRIHIRIRDWREGVVGSFQAGARSIWWCLQATTLRLQNLLCSRSSLGKSIDNAEDDLKMELERYAARVLERLSGSTSGRIDHMLQDSTFQYQYLAAFKAHTAYWKDMDTALWILRHLYRDTPRYPTPEVEEEEDDTIWRQRQLSLGAREQHARLAGLDDDDLVALTFSGRKGRAASALAAAYQLSCNM